MKVVSWNINGIRTLDGGIKKALQALDADILCVQETKVTRDLLDERTAIIDGYSSYFSFSRGRSGYSGVATYCKDDATPFAAEEGLTGLLSSHGGAVGCYGDHEEFTDEELQLLDNEGRAVITQHRVRCQDKTQTLTVINVYCPRADPEKPERKRFKLQFYKLLQGRAEALLRDGSVIVLGDINTSHRPIDHCDPSDADDFEENPGRKWLGGFLGEAEGSDLAGGGGGRFVDTFRLFHPTRGGAFTCWSTLTGARRTNYGTRIDYIFADCRLAREQFAAADILPEVEGSDHCPVWGRLRCRPLAAPRAPPLATCHRPEFAGKQQKLSRFLVKTERKDPPPEAGEGLPGSQEDGERRENLGVQKAGKRPPPAAAAAPKGKKAKVAKASKPQGSLLAFFKPRLPTAAPGNETAVLDEINSEVTEDRRHEKGASEKGASLLFWKSVLAGPPAAPPCKAHGEPCVLRTVKKDGPNLGRQFFVCARPQGHASNPDARCNFFAWVDQGK